MFMLQAALQISYYGPIVVFSIGTPAALLNAIIFMGIKTLRQSSTSYYVVGQSLADMSALLVVFLQTIPSTSMLASSMACKLSMFFLQSTACVAMSCLCLAAFDRWACTSQLARIRQLSSTRIACRLVPLPFLIWPLVNIPFLIYSDLVPPTYNCWFNSDLFKQIANYFLNPMLAVVFPLCILITFGLLTCRNIRLVTHIRQQRIQTHLPMWEQQMTRMMLTQTFFSIICASPRAIFIMYWTATYGEDAKKSCDQISIELLINQLSAIILCFNFSSSFFVFLCVSPRLRETLKIHLKRLFNLRQNQIGATNIYFTRPRIIVHNADRENVNPAIATEHV
ncbi:unnamed protein product [Rotaria sp. Silwood2]|nr:unnamed protein product [Rotaria sp. Silwood2]CAF2771926.1 unnamed protein product [Rotaria sp. Silwood2]CAF3345030.1 unnamed protein product [Rotaria sp. Silwood2]CAF4267285.1 unnamed protein product [Rotaria sp. Silwood2]CAF4354236.1 unnamed protein product [Rotaria sp. Silwood2]